MNFKIAKLYFFLRAVETTHHGAIETSVIMNTKIASDWILSEIGDSISEDHLFGKDRKFFIGKSGREYSALAVCAQPTV